jgi:hypothetical protein
MDAAALLTLRPAKRAALRTARQCLTLARGPAGLSLVAALNEPLPRTPRQWAALLLTATLPLLLVAALSRWLLMGWHAVMLGWAPRLGLPLEPGAGDALVWRGLDSGALTGGPLALAVAGLAVLAVFTASLWLPARLRLGRHLLWALCGVQAVAVLLAAWRPELLPPSPTAYLSTLLHAGFYLMFTLPVLLALGLSALKMGWAARLGCIAGVLAYFALMLPHKMLLLALLLQALPMVWAPLLFVLLGVVADLLVFLALFALLSASRPLAR